MDSYACIYREFNIKKSQPLVDLDIFDVFTDDNQKNSSNMWNCISILELYLCIQHKTMLLSVPLQLD